jgi:hypothetical protein
VLTAAFWLDLLELLTVGSAAVACVLTAIVAAPVNVRGSASFLPPLPRNRHERAE